MRGQPIKLNDERKETSPEEALFQGRLPTSVWSFKDLSIMEVGSRSVNGSEAKCLIQIGLLS